MKKTIKIWSSILLVVSSIILLIICAVFLFKSHTANDTIQEEKNTILIYNSFGEEDEKNTLINDIIDEYTDTKNIEINNISLTDVEFYKKLNMDLVTNNSPDIIITRPEKRIEDLFLEGKICSLNEEFKNDIGWYSRFDKSALRFTSYDDDIYGIPMVTEYYALFYNVEIFKKYGLKPPKTLEDLEYIVKILDNNNIIPFAYSAEDDTLFQAILASLTNSIVIDTGLNYDNVSYYLKTMEIMKKLYQNNSFPKNFEILSKNESMNLLCDGNAAMYVGGADFIRYIEDYKKNYSGTCDTDNKFDVSFFPDMGGDVFRTNTLVFDVGEFSVFILNKDNNHDDIMDFVKYFTSEKIANFLYSNTKSKSTIKNIDLLARKKQLETNYRLLEAECMEYIRMPKSKVDGYIWSKCLIGNLINVMKGNVEPETVCVEAIRMQNSID